MAISRFADAPVSSILNCSPYIPVLKQCNLLPLLWHKELRVSVISYLFSVTLFLLTLQQLLCSKYAIKQRTCEYHVLVLNDNLISQTKSVLSVIQYTVTG